MMTRRMMQATEQPFNSQRGLSIFGAIVSFVILVIVIGGYWQLRPSTEGFMTSMTEVPEAILQGSVAELGRNFVALDAYVIPFELASVLLLAAIVGAIVVAWPEAEDRT
jgi:NADH:ubiquinone oxidoreductase subunit 6 (subunit J)